MKLIPGSSLPKWYSHNERIVNGYRHPDPSFVNCFKSIFSFHNESGNIFSHLIAFICFAILSIQTNVCNSYKKFETKDKLMFSTFFAGSLICFFFSTLFHTLHCHSRNVFKLFAKLDYMGIILLISLSTISWNYFGFYNSRIPFIFYTSLTIFLAIISIIVIQMDRFSEPEFRAIRGVMFIVEGLAGIAPFVHFCRYFHFVDPMASEMAFKSLLLMALMAVIYITGALIYIFHIPERLYPNTFDYWFNSHQLFHIFTIAGALIFFHCLSLIAQSRLDFPPNPSNNSTFV